MNILLSTPSILEPIMAGMMAYIILQLNKIPGHIASLNHNHSGDLEDPPSFTVHNHIGKVIESPKFNLPKNFRFIRTDGSQSLDHILIYILKNGENLSIGQSVEFFHDFSNKADSIFIKKIRII